MSLTARPFSAAPVLAPSRRVIEDRAGLRHIDLHAFGDAPRRDRVRTLALPRLRSSAMAMTDHLPLESVVGFAGKVGGGLVLHPNGKTMAYPLGATIVVKELGDTYVAVVPAGAQRRGVLPCNLARRRVPGVRADHQHGIQRGHNRLGLARAERRAPHEPAQGEGGGALLLARRPVPRVARRAGRQLSRDLGRRDGQRHLRHAHPRVDPVRAVPQHVQQTARDGGREHVGRVGLRPGEPQAASGPCRLGNIRRDTNYITIDEQVRLTRALAPLAPA